MSRVFSRMRFSCQKPLNVMGFSGKCKRYNTHVNGPIFAPMSCQSRGAAFAGVCLYASKCGGRLCFGNSQTLEIMLIIKSAKSAIPKATGISAVYTCIKKPESFSHSGFSLKVARQLPLNTSKNPNRKTQLRSVIF